MRTLALLTLAAVTAAVGAPAASAKIYPQDFLPWVDSPWVDPTMPAEDPVEPPIAPLTDEPVDLIEEEFVPTEIHSGRLTRAEFAEAIATRLYGVGKHSVCFQELAGDTEFALLFRDVTTSAPYATSICLMMRNGLMRGDRDGDFRPNDSITASEAATVFSRLALIPRTPGSREAWYMPHMDALKLIDEEFTLRPWEPVLGSHMRRTMCLYGEFLPAIDPLAEFTEEC